MAEQNTPSGDTPKSTKKRDALREIEIQVQKKWEEHKVFEDDAPADPNSKPKYMATFPYPYMNGRLHLGHTFTLAKAEFSVGYQRLQGKNTLFPFSFHCTGMPIKTSADKLAVEISKYGNPPQFPIEEDEPEKKPKQDVVVDHTKFKSKKAKSAAKSGKKSAKQWEILQMSGIPDEEIPKFQDAAYWLQYFPPLAQSDLKDLGVKVDWRRSFITTEVNPFYDAFVRWQFITLKKLGKVQFGKRYTIYSPKDGQPCMDHDRAEGEGVLPQDYTLIKQELLEPYPEKLASLKDTGKKVYLVPATLRPNTMYGQTNCFILPEGEYGAFEINDTDIFVCTERAARNMSFQGLSPEFGVVKCLAKFKGLDIIGAALKAPLATYDKIYVLPMETISTTKGTGVVTSVPSDAPDDYMCLKDLKTNEKMRTKYFTTSGLKPEMVDPFEVVKIINVPGYGEDSAASLCEKKKISSHKDKTALEELKKLVYLDGFNHGVMLVGDYKGQVVKECISKIKQDLIDAGQALPYSEPNGRVVSRSGDVCVVCLCDQWYVTYGEQKWKESALKCLEAMNTYGNETRNMFAKTFDWMNQWACSRSYGLGTKVPWDEKYLIESLSDSTIYMAFYTIAHLLLGKDNIAGAGVGPLGIKAEQLTPEVFDYIFLDSDAPDTAIPTDALNKLRAEFRYWYPVDLRVSGKDLVTNHLTFYIYTHTALWGVDKWPKAVRANGHIMLNQAKMSKSTGNFLTLADGIKTYGADAMRLALADSGDTIDDANFTHENATGAILKLYTYIDWVKETLAELPNYREGPPSTFADKVFAADISEAIRTTKECYEQALYRDVTRNSFYQLKKLKEYYDKLCSAAGDKPNRELLLKFITVQAILISPITPHMCEYIWSDLLKNDGFIANAKWPEPIGDFAEFLFKKSYVEKNLHTWRTKRETYIKPRKGPKKPAPNCFNIYVALKYPEVQAQVINTIKAVYDKTADLPAEARCFPSRKDIIVELRKVNSAKKFVKDAMKVISAVEASFKSGGESAFTLQWPFSEIDTLTDMIAYIKAELQVDEVNIYTHDAEGNPDPINRTKFSVPGKPIVIFSGEKKTE